LIELDGLDASMGCRERGVELTLTAARHALN